MIYISTANGHSMDYGSFRDHLVWCSSSQTRAAKKWADDLNKYLLTLDQVDWYDKEKLSDEEIAGINAEYAIQECHLNIKEEHWAAFDFTHTIDENKRIRPQIKWSAVLRELKKGDGVHWQTNHYDMDAEGVDTWYSLTVHENI